MNMQHEHKQDKERIEPQSGEAHDALLDRSVNNKQCDDQTIFISKLHEYVSWNQPMDSSLTPDVYTQQLKRNWENLVPGLALAVWLKAF